MQRVGALGSRGTPPLCTLCQTLWAGAGRRALAPGAAAGSGGRHAATSGHAAPPPPPSSAYSAGDHAEKRKNPGVYKELAAPDAASGDTADTDAPSVSYMVTAGSAASPGPQAAGGGQAAHAAGLVKPEVLAPAGGWPQLKAACESGADAVYFGLSDFSARARASNFSPEELPDVMSYLHERGVKGFVALNVLVFDEELGDVEQRARAMAEAGVDAVIVQDLGVVELLRRVAPNLPVHGSTQMTVTSPEGADFVAGMGVDRVVVGRELSIREIAKVHAGTNIEVEAFVHGALCVSYSGQCFSSEAWGGRSANRGQCAQACRMPYGLIEDGQIKEMGDIKYLLSPQDLMAVEQVPELIQAGVSCFKIEGRLKGPEYVGLTTRVYRNAVDAAWASMCAALEQQQQEEHAQQQQQLEQQDNGVQQRPGVMGKQAAAEVVAAAKDAVKLTDRQRWDLEQVFSRGQDQDHRGLTPGFLEGVVHQRLVRGRAPRHRGVYLGEVSAVMGATGPRGGGPGGGPGAAVALTLHAPLKRGDGVVFDCGEPEEQEVGGSVYEVLLPNGRAVVDGSAAPGQEVLVRLGPDQGRLQDRVQVGDLVWKTRDPEVEQRVRRGYENLSSADKRKAPVDVTVEGTIGQKLVITLRDDTGLEVSAASAVPLQAAGSRPMTLADLQKAVGQLGENVLDTRSLDTSRLDLAAGLFLPASELKAVRRAAATALLQRRRSHARALGLAPEPVLPALLEAARERPCPEASTTTTTNLTHEQQEEASSGASSGAAVSAESTDRPSAAAVAADSGLSPSERAAAGLRVLCRSRAQVDAACDVPWLREVVLDFLEVQGLKEAVASVRAAGKRVVVATPRVLKPDEERLVHFYLRLQADALLVRSLGMLNQMALLGGAGARVDALGGLTVPALEGDFSLNAANVLSADVLLTRGALLRLAPTHDLNAPQVARLARGLGPRAALLEAVVHQHLPIFHTEHCVFCRFLSTGNSFKDCGHPCERTTLHLRDQEGKDHLVLADMGCRNTVFNAQAQSGLWALQDFIKAGIHTLRVELVDEPAEFVQPILEAYRDAILGHRPPSALWAFLGTLPDANGRAHGISAGSLQAFKESGRALKETAYQREQGQRERQRAGGAAGRW